MSRGGLPGRGRGRGSRGSRRKRFGDNGFEAWGGYMNAKKSKLEEQFSDQASKECQDALGIFHNVAIFVNGYTGDLLTCCTLKLTLSVIVHRLQWSIRNPGLVCCDNLSQN